MATLKISDLSVGDWVLCGEDTIPYKIIGIDSKVHPNVTLCDSYYPQGVIAFLDMIHPIPITAEILEKNGWRVIEKEVFGDEYEYDGEERVWDDGNCKTEICEAKQGVFWYSCGNEYYMWRLEYIHQLQHLIRLAGLDREINL